MNQLAKKLFMVSWITYFISYLGRLNYAATMLQIGLSEGYNKAQLGAVVTALFISYGIGQLISGILGDRYASRPLVLMGLITSCLCNFLVFISTEYWQLLFIWFINGFAMSLLWSPMLKLFTLYIPKEFLHKCCFMIQTSVALGTCFTYLGCSLLLKNFHWRYAFLGASFLLFLAALLWQHTLRSIEHEATPLKISTPSPLSQGGVSLPFPKLLFGSGFVLILVSVLTMGILKDGIMTWIPQFMTDTFSLNTSFSIFLSALLPLVNLLGLYFAKKLHQSTGEDDLKTSFVFYAASFLSLCLLVYYGTTNLVACLLLFACVTSCMLGINTILVGILPTYFMPYNKVSTVAGLTNATMYLGSALCGYGLGSFSDRYGWDGTLILLVIICFLGLITCIIPIRLWQNFKKNS